MRAHTVVHLDLGEIVPGELLHCEQADRRMSFRLVDSNTQVWLTGTGVDFLRFADDMERLAARVRAERTEVPS